jgi:hypothetical protein
MAIQHSPNLYERLGGVYSIATVIDDPVLNLLPQRAPVDRAFGPTYGPSGLTRDLASGSQSPSPLLRCFA